MEEERKILINKGFKTKLDPNNKQKTMLAKAAGCARYAYNWALAKHIEQYENGEKFMGKIDMNKLFTATEKQEHEWLYESTKCSPQQAIRDCDTAFMKLFREHTGYPNFKKKGYGDSFYADGTIYIKDNKIHIPMIGLVRIHEKLEKRAKRGHDDVRNIKIKSIVVSKDSCGDWFVSFSYETEITFIGEKEFNSCGADPGIKTFSTLSTGEVFETPKKYKQLFKKLKRTQKQLSRCPTIDKVIINKKGNKQTVKIKAGSKNGEKKRRELAKIHRDIRNERVDATNQHTNSVTKNHSDAVIENLNVAGMMRNHKLAAMISNSNFGEQKRQLKYKGEWNSCNIYEANTFFPSSKTCSCCDHKKDDLKLSDRVYYCEECGLEIDRDFNASVNLNMLLYSKDKFMKWIVGATEDQFNDIQRRINNRKIYGDSLRTPQGSGSEDSVRVDETGIRQQGHTKV